MGLFATPNPFDGIVEKVTDGRNTSEDWGQILDLCDRVSSCANGPKDCLKAILKRLNHQDPHVVILAITVLDACVNNCGKDFRLEVASRDFESEFRKLLSKSHPKVREKLRGLLKNWAEGEFKGDAQLGLIPSLYNALKREGVDFSSYTDQPKKAEIPKDPNVVSSQQEEEDIAKAIQLSLQESKAATHATSSAGSSHATSSSSSSTLYPSNSLQSPAKQEEKKARALYDFEAAEDNELTFKAGEIVIIIDDSDANWWKGSNHRGSGLFPANFVTKDLEAEPEEAEEAESRRRRRSVQFNEEVEVVETSEPVEIDESKIDEVMRLLHEADPTAPESDDPGLPGLEDQVNSMGPLIDNELESVDRRHAQLTRLSTELVDALNLYHQLMHDNVNNMMGPAMPGTYGPYAVGQPQMYGPAPSSYGQPAFFSPPSNAAYPATPMGVAEPQIYAGSAPPPTPPLADPATPQHYGAANFPINGAPPVAVPGFNQPPQM